MPWAPGVPGHPWHWEQRASIFLKAAALIAGPYRSRMNAATMIAQSKNIHQAEIDAACELIDFLRFNVEYMAGIYDDQPESDEGIWNRVEYRPLEGFVYAITPFNFTAIAGNLPTSAAMMGNVVLWKPSDHQVFSAHVIMEVLQEAGLPAGVINLVYGDPAMITKVALSSPEFSGIHYTGSTKVFRSLWQQIGNNIAQYKSYPRIVGKPGVKILFWPTLQRPRARWQQPSPGVLLNSRDKNAPPHQGFTFPNLRRIPSWNWLKKTLAPLTPQDRRRIWGTLLPP